MPKTAILKEDFTVLKDKIRMQIYDMNGQITERQKHVEYLHSLLRLVEAEEKAFCKE